MQKINGFFFVLCGWYIIVSGVDRENSSPCRTFPLRQPLSSHRTEKNLIFRGGGAPGSFRPVALEKSDPDWPPTSLDWNHFWCGYRLHISRQKRQACTRRKFKKMDLWAAACCSSIFLQTLSKRWSKLEGWLVRVIKLNVLQCLDQILGKQAAKSTNNVHIPRFFLVIIEIEIFEKIHIF